MFESEYSIAGDVFCCDDTLSDIIMEIELSGFFGNIEIKKG